MAGLRQVGQKGDDRNAVLKTTPTFKTGVLDHAQTLCIMLLFDAMQH